MTTTAKLNEQHDYITLLIKFSDRTTLRLTKSRNGVSASGEHASRALLTFLDAWFRDQKGTFGEAMKRLQSVAAESLTIKDFLKGL